MSARCPAATGKNVLPTSTSYDWPLAKAKATSSDAWSMALQRSLSSTAWLNRDECPRHLEFVQLASQRDSRVGVPGTHFADAADGDDNLVVGDVLEALERVHIRDLPKELGLRIGTRHVEASRRDLQMKVTKRVVRVVVPSFDEERRCLKLLD